MKSLFKKYFSRILLFFLRRYSNEKIECEKIHKVLLLCYMGIGNLVLMTPMIKTLKKLYPQIQIDILTGDNQCVQVLQGASFISNIIFYHTKQNSSILNTIQKIRKNKYDIIMGSFHALKKKLPWIIMLGGSKYQLVHKREEVAYSWFFENISHPIPYVESLHEAEQNNRLLIPLNIDDFESNAFFCLNENNRKEADKILDSVGIKVNDEFIVIQPDSWAEMSWKRWPSEYFAKIADMLIDKYKIKVIILGAASEKTLGNQINKMMKHSAINLMGSTTIKQAAAVLERSKMVICNDSGLMHISAAVGSHVFALYGPTDYVRTSPIGENIHIIKNDMECSPCHSLNDGINIQACSHRKCLTDLKPEKVFEIITQNIEV